MADDPHSQRISAERAIMELTGASRSQIRAAALGTPLRDAVTNFQLRNGGNSTVQPPPTPKIETVDQAFEPKPFRIDSGNANTGDGNAMAQGGETHTFTFNENGAPGLWSIGPDGAKYLGPVVP